MPGSEKLISGLRELNLFSEKLAFTMDKYIGEIILFNSAYNLTNTSDYDEIVVKHVLDSLSAASIIEKIAENLQSELKSLGNSKIRIADIGSGGGFPGIPLAAALPDFDFVLVERMDKRCAFLENEAAILGLKNVSVMKNEAEKIPPESFDLVIFRAFRPLDKKMATTLLSITKKDGTIAAFKAKKTYGKLSVNIKFFLCECRFLRKAAKLTQGKEIWLSSGIKFFAFRIFFSVR